jgi:hypothetical protein
MRARLIGAAQPNVAIYDVPATHGDSAMASIDARLISQLRAFQHRMFRMR